MSKVILEFDKFEDKDEWEAAVNVGVLQSSLMEIQNILRAHDKYERYNNTDEMVQDIRNAIEENEVWRFIP